jgi:hypothetical protein
MIFWRRPLVEVESSLMGFGGSGDVLCAPLQVLSSLGRVSFTKIAISLLFKNLARHVFGEMPKPVKIAQIDPNFFSTLQLLPVSHTPIFTPIRYPRHLLFHHLPFIANLFALSAKNIFPLPNFKPSTHFTHFHSYIPIREVSAQFQVISCPISNFKLSMAQFTVQTPFSHRLTSVFPNHSIIVS